MSTERQVPCPGAGQLPRRACPRCQARRIVSSCLRLGFQRFAVTVLPTPRPATPLERFAASAMRSCKGIISFCRFRHALLQGNYFVVAAHHDHGPKLQTCRSDPRCCHLRRSRPDQEGVRLSPKLVRCGSSRATCTNAPVYRRKRCKKNSCLDHLCLTHAGAWKCVLETASWRCGEKWPWQRITTESARSSRYRSIVDPSRPGGLRDPDIA
jgi:hypothetical protein